MISQLDIKSLDCKYKEIEGKSLSVNSSNTDDYLCFRMDGIKSSKRHLKDVISNQLFDKSLKDAINSVYHLNKNQTRRDNCNLFFCAFSASDEVSFIINKGDNYYGNRVFKMGTVLSSTLSSAMTIQFELMTREHGKKKCDREKRYPDVMAFDARPLILDDVLDVKEYIKYRWLIACRNAACKVLRLKSELSTQEIYDGELNNSLELLLEKVNHLGLSKEYQNAVDSFCLYVPDSERNFASIKINENNFDDTILKIDEFVFNSKAITKQSR